MKTFNQRYREILLETFSFAIEFLNSHNLKWYVAGGTMIGTMRHKGLIPWDDDIDISMPRNDFERLLKLRKELLPTNYEIHYLDEDKDYYMPFAKLCHKNSSLWEFEYYPCIFGVYVDIFPMDLVRGGRDEIKKTMPAYQQQLNRLRRSLVVYKNDAILSMLKKCELRKVLGILRDKYFHPLDPCKEITNFREYETRLSQPGGDYYVCFGGAYGYKEIYDKQWFDASIQKPFEDLMVNVPNGYDAILTQNYGDYMTPPPPEKRMESHDDRYYCNLKERVSIEEVQRRVAKGIKREF